VPTNAEAIASALSRRGVEILFGLPGGEIVAFIDACRRHGIRFLLTGHEASAAWMAQVTGQITGVPGVCASTLGPGATNLITGVANALLDRAPMLAVTAQIPAASIATMTHQRLPLHDLFRPVAKASLAVEGSFDTDRALDLALDPRPGPVHISLASDVAIQELGPGSRSRAHAFSTPSTKSIARRIAESRRPIVLIGLGATPATSGAIGALLDRLQCPFLVTPKVKGIVTEDHPLFLGVASGMAIDRDILETIHAADLIIGVGFDPVECDKTWFAKTEIVAIDSVSMAEGDYHPLESIGNIAELLATLDDVVPKPWPPELIESRRASLFRKPADGLSPLRVIEELRSIFPRDGIVTCDVGSHKLVMGQFWRSYHPGTFFMSNGLSGMGFGIPAAIAAQLAHPERPVLAIVGDGGMLMMLHDLTLIRELALPIAIVVFTDRSLSLIRVSEHRRGLAPYGVDFHPPDFAAIAEAFGIPSTWVATVADLRATFEHALSRKTPHLFDVPIDFHEYYDLA
jgi:acetolactate synthase I/II/III large subunit